MAWYVQLYVIGKPKGDHGPTGWGHMCSVYHTIIQKSILVLYLRSTKNREDQMKTNSAILTTDKLIS